MMNPSNAPPLSSLFPGWIRRGIALLAVMAIAWLILPERGLAAQPNTAMICKFRDPGDLSCLQTTGEPPITHVFWHPQDATVSTNQSISLGGKVTRLTLAGRLPLNGTGNGSSGVGPNIMVGNIGSNTFSGGSQPTTYVLGNSAQTSITRLPSCTVSGSTDCLAVTTTGIASEKDLVTFGAGTNNAVYINRAMESADCLRRLYYWRANASGGGFVMGATTYGGGILNSSGDWLDRCSIIPVP
jgi:hypothetical protein